MSDLREQVARAIIRHRYGDMSSYDESDPEWGPSDDTLAEADVTIAVVIEELAQRAETEDQCLVSWHQVPGTRIPQEGDDLADWLRAQQETTHE